MLKNFKSEKAKRFQSGKKKIKLIFIIYFLSMVIKEKV